MAEIDLAIESALLPPDAAQQAWNSLLSTRSFDELEPAIVRILPAIYRNIGALEGTFAAPQLKGSVRYTWAKNTEFLLHIQPVISAAAVKKINYRLLKGGALNILYNDFSLRRMGDIDLLISQAEAAEFSEILAENGFTLQFESFCNHRSSLSILPEMNFINSSGIQIDLHLAEHRDDLHFFRGILKDPPLVKRVQGVNYLLPAPELLLLHAIHHGKLAVAPSDSVQGLFDFKEIFPYCNQLEIARQATKFALVETLKEITERLTPFTGSAYLPAIQRSRGGWINTADLSKAFLRLKRGLSAISLRRTSLSTLIKIYRKQNGHRYLYCLWIALGKLRPIERIIAKRFGGFLIGDQVLPDGPISILAQEVRFRPGATLNGTGFIVQVNSPLLERDEFLLFGDGQLLTTIGGDGDSHSAFRIQALSEITEYSLRLSRNACEKCARKFAELQLQLEPLKG